MAGLNMVTQAQVQSPGLASFRSATMKQITTGGSFTFTSLGSNTQFKVPATGYLSRVRLLVQGTITIPATPTGSWISYPFLPHGLFSNISTYTSENAQIVNTTGLGLLVQEITTAVATNPLVDPISANNTNNRAALYTAPSGVLTAGTFNINCLLDVKNFTDDSAMLGLLNAQTVDTSIYINVALANTVTTGTAPSAVNITVTPVYEFFSVPNPQVAQQPDQSFAHLFLEEFYPVASNGAIQYKPAVGPIYMSLKGFVENNGAPLAPSAFGNVGITYAQTISPYSEPYFAHVGRYKHYYGQVLPDGMFCWDQTLGGGFPYVDNNRDLLNTSQQSDLYLSFNFSGVTWVNGGIRVWKEMLVAMV